VLVAYTDGCVKACVSDVKSGSKGAVSLVARQTSGPLLYRNGSYGSPVPTRNGGGTPTTGAGAGTAGGAKAGTGSLAATGGTPLLAALALALLGGGIWLRRRRT
jgi:hypothetical protein